MRRGAIDLSTSMDRKRETRAGLATLLENAGDRSRVPIPAITTGGNPRKTFDPASIAELADSLKSLGLLQPILVRRTRDGYALVAGERRLRAARLLRWDDIPAIVLTVEDLPPELTNIAKIVENDQREDLPEAERAESYLAAVEGGIRQIDLARLTGRSRATVSRLVSHAKLLRAYPEARTLDSSTAQAIASAPEGEQQALIREGLSGKGHARERVRAKRGARSRDPELELERYLRKFIARHKGVDIIRVARRAVRS